MLGSVLWILPSRADTTGRKLIIETLFLHKSADTFAIERQQKAYHSLISLDLTFANDKLATCGSPRTVSLRTMKSCKS